MTKPLVKTLKGSLIGSNCFLACQAASEIFAESGVPELEAHVLSFLLKHGGCVKLLALLDDLARLLLQVCLTLIYCSFSPLEPHLI